MPERYPSDATLLALAQDLDTGVEYIPTGRSPYYLEFRRLVQRLLLATARANDLRVYADGDLSVGVRPGRYYLGDAAREFAGSEGIGVAPNATTWFWIDAEAQVQSSTAGLPADRTAFVPLARVEVSASTITTITDLRGEAFLSVPTLATLGLTPDAALINRVLSGVNESVDATALNILTGGADCTADTEHRHVQVAQDANAEVFFSLLNPNAGNAANVGLLLGLSKMADDLALLPSLDHGFLIQRYNGTTFNLVGSVHAAYRHEGTLTASQTGKLVGVVPIDGRVTDVILSVGTNLQSSNSGDGISAAAMVNGTVLTATPPALSSGAGGGFRSTAQGHGTAAAIKTDGTQNVRRGDVLTVDLTRTAAGTVSVETTHVVVLIVIRAARPE
jgi:hypothetical protein